VRSPFTEAEQYLHDSGLQTLALICREARLITWNEKYRGIELLQVDYNFPVLFLGSIILNRLFPTQPLLMSSRDCFMWQQLMQKLFKRGEYWYTSVLARTNADENYHRYIRSFGDNAVLVDLCGSGTSFSKMPQYQSVLLYRPASGIASVPAIVSSPACMRIEQANVAPHKKAVGVRADFSPIFVDKAGVDNAKEPNTLAQVNAFTIAMSLLDYYDLSPVLNASSDKCQSAMSYLLHHYFDFKEAVEPLRLLAIAEDK